MLGCLRAMPGCFFFVLCYFFIIRKFCKLLFTAEKGKVCYFFIACNFNNYFLLLRRAGFIFYSLCDWERVQLDFF
jgi:hypothetical protein